jgi:hypothetical protein
MAYFKCFLKDLLRITDDWLSFQDCVNYSVIQHFITIFIHLIHSEYIVKTRECSTVSYYYSLDSFQ